MTAESNTPLLASSVNPQSTPKKQVALMTHGDTVTKLPEGFVLDDNNKVRIQPLSLEDI